MDAPLGDGEVPDAPPADAPFDPTSCSVPAGDYLEIATDFDAAERRVALAAGPSSWALAYHQRTDGLDEIWVAGVPSTGLPTVRQLTSTALRSREPAIVSTGSGWLLAWIDPRFGRNEIVAQAVAGDLSPLGMPSRVTDTVDGESGPTLVALPTGSYLAAWVELRAMTMNVGMTRVLSATGAPTAAATMASMMGDRVQAPTLAARSAGAVLAWGEPSRMPPAARVLALDAAGGPSGSPMVASDAVEGTDGTVDVTMGPLGGAVVYGVLVAGLRPELRFRALDDTGSPVESVRTVAETGRDASIAAFGGGFVVSYRSGAPDDVIRLAFLDAVGNGLGEIDLGPAEPQGGRTTVRVTDDGRILVAWADTFPGAMPEYAYVRAARVRCD